MKPICLLSFLSAILFSCDVNRELIVVGYATCGEMITVKNNIGPILDFRAEEQNDGNSTCFFYQKAEIAEKKEINLNVIVDSNNVRLLDSLIIIPVKNRKPYISILSKNGRKTIFVGDQADPTFHRL